MPQIKRDFDGRTKRWQRAAEETTGILLPPQAISQMQPQKDVKNKKIKNVFVAGEVCLLGLYEMSRAEEVKTLGSPRGKRSSQLQRG